MNESGFGIMYDLSLCISDVANSSYGQEFCPSDLKAPKGRANEGFLTISVHHRKRFESSVVQRCPQSYVAAVPRSTSVQRQQ